MLELRSPLQTAQDTPAISSWAETWGPNGSSQPFLQPAPVDTSNLDQYTGLNSAYQGVGDAPTSNPFQGGDGMVAGASGSGGGAVGRGGLDPTVSKAVQRLKPLYVQAQNATGVPWQILAAIDYRENNNSPTRSALSGEKIGTRNPDGGGVTTSKLDSLIRAGQHLQSKTTVKLTANSRDKNLIGNALFGYNGLNKTYAANAQKYGYSQGFEGSPYVMNRYDTARNSMGIVTRDHGGVDGKDKRYGSYTLFEQLLGANI